jgi:hypothetical protein
MVEVILLILAVAVGITMAMRMDVEPRAEKAAAEVPAAEPATGTPIAD